MFKVPFSDLPFSRKPFSLVNGEFIAVSRYYTTLDPAAGSHFRFDLVTVSESEPFELGLTGTFSNRGFYIAAKIEAISGDGRILITSAGEVWFGEFVRFVIPPDDFAYLTNGFLHSLKIVRVGVIASLRIDGRIVDTLNDARFNFQINSLGAKWAGTTSVLFFGGVVANFYLNVDSHMKIKNKFNSNGLSSIEVSDVGPNATRINLTSENTDLYTKQPNNTWIGLKGGVI
ncbi:hypothetical protein K6Y31_20790 [Motilimonas cestriensis]|uniref:Uncharacterized protein n=1 Tax=Motilimonas cestriensis TaxID=2742685 RepID=A0ABS8WIN0_9GAMM|nr:hypothetical protein [Motilimonas cestriensis]MCE2597215.1 hypothetical protein [Motilimonas cestriensis]